MTKQIEGGMVEMCNLSALIVEKGIAEGIAKGIAKGIAEGKAKGRAEGEEVKAIEIAMNLIAGGILSDEQIADATGLPVDEIKKLHPEKQ